MPTRQFSADASDLPTMIAARKQDRIRSFPASTLVVKAILSWGCMCKKNLMDAIELERMPKALRVMLLQLARILLLSGYEKLAGNQAELTP